MNFLKKSIIRLLAGVALAASPAAVVTSCQGMVYDDLDPCREGVRLRFVFDYNMEFANAFPAQVDCLTLLVYDDAGNYITTVTETSDVLADENWRMTIDLPQGKTYRFVAYGGLACDDASFHFVQTPDKGSALTSLEVAMNADCVGADPGVDLHPLFYGNLNLEIPASANDYVEGTVYMMKDTNNIRILLENVDGTPVKSDDFIFEITDDNTLLGYNNDVIPTSTVTYNPWAVGEVSAGSTDDGTEAILAFAEFSTSRLIKGSQARLVIKNRETGDTVFSIPLVNCLLLLKSEQFRSMDAQEFLDRESRWNMIFFLEGGRWLDTKIVINNWIVRINHSDL